MNRRKNSRCFNYIGQIYVDNMVNIWVAATVYNTRLAQCWQTGVQKNLYLYINVKRLDSLAVNKAH